MQEDDVIYRQAAIDAIKKHYRAHDNDLLELIAFDIERLPSAQTNLDRIYAELSRAYNVPGLPKEAIGIIGDLMVSLDEPSIQQTEEFQWCDDCKEYDKQRHCCPRWNRVIRQTVEELNGHQAEEMEKYRNYQIEWLTSHNDLELDPVVEGLVVRFLTDTAEMYKTERGTYEAD